MNSFILACFSALWLGILTSISPCPLATNIAAISYISKRIGNPRWVFWSGILYMLGRMLAYTAVGIIVVLSLLSMHEISYFLQEHMNKLIGPILIVAGLVLLNVLKINFPNKGISESFQKRIEMWGVGGAFLLGAIFALSFCPISAALFFGSLIPLALERGSGVALPSIFGAGTALPVFVFAILIASGARFVGRVFDKLTLFELWARRITGVVFIVVGVYQLFTYTLKIFL